MPVRVTMVVTEGCCVTLVWSVVVARGFIVSLLLTLGVTRVTLVVTLVTIVVTLVNFLAVTLVGTLFVTLVGTGIEAFVII